jgi:hypothetical protein
MRMNKGAVIIVEVALAGEVVRRKVKARTPVGESGVKEMEEGTGMRAAV